MRILPRSIVLVAGLAFAAAVAGKSLAEGSGEPRVLAQFRGGQITIEDLQAAIAGKAWTTRQKAATPEGRVAFLRELETFDLLVLEAERRGYAQHPSVQQAVKETAIATMQVKELDPGPAAVPEADLQRAFEQQKALRSKPRVRRASHVQVATEAEALALTKELLHADAVRFAAVARERSQDERSRRQGGEIGHFDEQGRLDTGTGSIPAELARAAFAQKIGTVSRRPIAHADGFSVLLVTGEIPAIEPTLVALEPELREQLRKDRLVRAFDALIEQLRGRIPIETRPDLLQAIELDPPAQPDIPQGFPAAPADPRRPDLAVEDDGA